MNTYPWFEENISAWHKAIEKQHVPHAILLSGSRGIGKIQLAKNMAHIAMCENLSPSNVCHSCSSCHLLAADNHPDLTIIRAEKATILVDQIRQLSQKVNLSSTRSQYKVIIIENAHRMNTSAANALLKTLEEPPAKVILILTTSEIGRLLPTIKSRCVKTSLRCDDSQQTNHWLAKHTSAPAIDSELSLLIAGNAPLLALEILNNSTINAVLTMMDDLVLLKNQQKSVTEVSARWQKNSDYKHLNYCAILILNLIKLQLNLLTQANEHLLKYRNALGTEAKNIKILHNFIDEIFVFMQRLDTALKTELLTEELLINWQNAFENIKKE